MISTDAVNRVKYTLKNLIMILVWLTIFVGAISVNLTETDQLIATIVSTGLLKIFIRNLACQTQKKESWCGVVYHQMDFLVLTFSRKQLRVQCIGKC